MPLVCCSVCCLLSFVGVYYILCCHVTRDAPGEVHSAPQCSDSALTVLKTVLGSQKHGKYQRFGQWQCKTIEIWNSRLFIDSFTTPVAIPTVFTVLWCAGTVWSTVGALSGHCGALCCHVVLHKFVGPPLFAWRSPVSGTVDGQNPAPPHHFTLEGSHSNPRAPSFTVGATPLRRWCRILDLQLVFVFSLWWPQC